MGNTDSAPTSTAAAPHAHSHHGHGHLPPHTNGGNMNGHIAIQTKPNSNSNGNSSAVYAGTVHQVVDTRGAPIGSDYVDIGSAFEAMSKEDMERRFLEIVVSHCLSI